MKYFVILFFSFALLFFNQTALGLEQEISDQDSCEMFGGNWHFPNMCQVNGTIEIDRETFLKIAPSMEVQISSSSTLMNSGTIDNLGTIQNYGILNNRGGSINSNGGTILNDGVIENNGGTINNNLGLIDNKGSIDVGFYGTLNNDGIIRDSGIITGGNPSSIRNIPSPLKQTQNGIPTNSIECRGSLQLVIKTDNSPACVKIKTIPNLIERKWIMEGTLPTDIPSALDLLSLDTDPFAGDTHYDRVDRDQKYWATLSEIKLLDDNSIGITFSDNDYRIEWTYRNQPEQVFQVPDFEYIATIKEGKTFAALCTEASEKKIHVLKYDGIIQKEEVEYYVFWHKVADFPEYIRCDYPEIIQHSLDVDFNFGVKPLQEIWDHDWE